MFFDSMGNFSYPILSGVEKLQEEKVISYGKNINGTGKGI